MWAFGCTCYEVLHLKPMFSGSFFTLMSSIANGELSDFEADCPEDFKEAIMQCFEASPEDRPEALEFIETVENVKFEMQRSLTSHRYVDNCNNLTRRCAEKNFTSFLSIFPETLSAQAF